ncbi:hypothetical protein, partial [Corynebacterium striatum]|uniref:hypothetical protein n=4 Tax=Corynebacterium striatum TaxID=43770 RepID=UPI0019552550
LHRHIFRQDAVLNETDHAVLRILVKFSWHIPDFSIYSNGTKPGALQIKDLVATKTPHNNHGPDPGQWTHRGLAMLLWSV